MSVQVRRRREAAAYLQTFVGAQGELLVDTTSNRVQVHDGARPGGWPAAGITDVLGYNLGINTSGAINQRAVSGTVSLAAGQYGHDRMKGGAAGCTYTFATAANGDTTFTISAGSLMQAIDAPNLFATALWLTWTGGAAARVAQGAASSAPAYGMGVAVPIDGTIVNAILATGLALGTITNVEFGTGTLNTTRPWQLEAALPNAGPTRLARRHWAIEVPLCQRYFQRWQQPPLRGVYGSNFAQRMGMVITPMRAAPSVTMNGNLPLFNGGAATTAASIANNYSTTNTVEVDLSLTSVSGFGTFQMVVVYQNGSSSIDVNAEI